MKTIYLIAALAPLVGAIVAGLWGRKIGRAGAHSVTILGVLVSLLCSLYVFNDVVFGGTTFNGSVYEWSLVGGLKFEVGFLIDTLTATMMCVVTFVSLMVHVYTIGYMAEDPGYQRFFSYISLFTFSMMMLVMANNFLQLFFGWEAVGLVSYLLIGFWYTRPTAIYANMKAFLVNRVGDFGFILGIGLLLAHTGTLDYAATFRAAPDLATQTITILGSTPWQLITVACICLFIGAMGKSAQFPLHVWLPDSMEGPTPISALIHAATMVTAGIFMVSRMSPLFELSDVALGFVITIGAITALFMGFLGIIQNDIKRVVAYSTLSQLGYMTVALGSSAYSVAIFHLMTHAFFKALLFLAAGSVIMGMHHDQDMRNMGGLRKYMPITWITSLVGSLALVATPFFAGFYSKDTIIEASELANVPGAHFAHFAVLAGVFVTSFYSFRMYFMVFHGKERWREGLILDETGVRHLPDADGHGHGHAAAPAHAPAIPAAAHGGTSTSHAVASTAHAPAHGAGHGHGAHGAEDPAPNAHEVVHEESDEHEHHGLGPNDKPHESPLVVTLPLILLAIPSVIIGAIAIGPMLYGKYFDGVIFVNEHHPAMEELAKEFHGWVAMGVHAFTTVPFWLAVAGFVAAYFCYMVNPAVPARIKASVGPLYRLLDNKYYMDRINEIVFAGGARSLGRGLWKAGDQGVIDGFFVNGSAKLIGAIAGLVRRLQTGFIYHYAIAMILGVAAGMLFWIVPLIKR